MEELDRQLKELAELAKAHPIGSRNRNKYVTRLLMMIESSGKLYCEGRFSYPLEVYDEAIQELRLYIFRSIDKYDPTRAKMMTWVNQKLNFAFKDAIRRFRSKEESSVSLDINIYGEAEDGKTLQDVLSTELSPLLSEQIKKYIEEDPDDAFKQKHIKRRPEINFQTVALHMFAGYRRRELAEMWEIEEQTLYSFFSRACKSFKPLFDEYLKA